VRPRTQSSLALSLDGARWLVVNASPDIGAQIRATPALWPTSGQRHSPIAAVILTSAEIDHCAGLLSLRERHAFHLFATAALHAELEASPVFGALDRALVHRTVVAPEAQFEAAGISCELVTIPGKPPLYAECDAPAIGLETGDTVALSVEAGGRRLLYAPGCAAFSNSLLERLEVADLVLFDGTLFTEDEMIVEGLGTKTAQRMGHLPISGVAGTLKVLARLPGRRVYVHINNTNPILIEGSAERLSVEAAGIEIAFDGMELAL
jgi:pyrroloquinoline quinone biosynthesis protein B